MVKRALCIAAAALTVAGVLAFAGVAIATSAPAPHNTKRALKIVHADVMKLARDYSHKRYRAVCSDFTKKERAHLGGTTSCMLKIAVINAFVPIKKFTITAAKLGKRGTQATVSLYVNGNKKHRIHAVAVWEGGKYRLDHESGWKPKL